MHAVGAVACAALVALTFAGCLNEQTKLPDLAALFETEFVSGNGTADLLYASPLGRVAGGKEAMDPLVLHTVTIPKLVLTKPSPMAPGGGTRSKITFPELNFTAEFRVPKADQLVGYQVQWAVQEVKSSREDPDSPGLAWGAARGVGEAFPVTVSKYHATFVWARLVQAEKVSAYFAQPALIEIRVKVTAESTVFPVRARDTPPPQNFKEMADEFEISLERFTARLDANTSARQGGTTDVGTDVDLEIQTPDGAPARTPGGGQACSGSGGASSPGTPAEARETASALNLHPGAMLVRVGAMSEGCGDTWYQNAGPVAYKLDVNVVFTRAVKASGPPRLFA